MLETFFNFHWVDQLAVITGLIYVFLAARESIWCWPWGILSCSLIAYASFYFYQLYADALLQLFYVGMAFWGLYRWRYGDEGQDQLPISKMTWQQHLRYSGIALLCALPFGYLFGQYTDAAATYPDAITTAFAIMATILVIQKKLENWLYWIVIDIAYVFLYASRGAQLYAVLMGGYTLVAIFGYWNWQRRLRVNGT